MLHKGEGFVSALPREKYIEISDQLDIQGTLLVPVTITNSSKPSLYLEGGNPLTCKAFLNETDVEQYLNIESVASNIDPADLQFCPLPIGKLIASLQKISIKAQKSIVCRITVKHDDKLKDAGVFWTNHEPFMV